MRKKPASPKNPRRVAGQLKHKIEIQRQRTIAASVGLVVLLFIGIGAFFVTFIPAIVQIICLALCPLAVLAIIMEAKLKRQAIGELRSLSNNSN